MIMRSLEFSQKPFFQRLARVVILLQQVSPTGLTNNSTPIQRKKEMTEEKNVSKRDMEKRDVKVRDLQAVKDAKGGGGKFKPVSGGSGGGDQIPSPPISQTN
jgi:hypothetical protein